MNKKFNVLYVDDEQSNLNIFKNTFRRNYNIYTAESARQGLKILDEKNIDLILTDQRMPAMSGVEFLKNVIVKHPQPSRILITAYTDFDALKDAVNEAKIFQYIQKPWEEKEIQDIIDNALEIYQLKQKNIELTEKLKNKNEELIKLNQELLELDKLKFHFLNIISHEIRTPLNGLVGATQLIKDVIDEGEFKDYEELFDMLETSTKRLEHFLLLAERITLFKAENYKIEPNSFKLNQLICDVVEILNKKISDKNIILTYDFNKEAYCYADKQLIEICLLEIIDNAIKFSNNKGEIIIKTITDGQKQVIEVVDSGPGFSELVLKHVCKPFITNEDTSIDGMGLDLALIKLIVEAHGGIIDIKNNKSKPGSTVRLEFNTNI